MNFSVSEIERKISNLSGGQKAKLILLEMVLDKCNVLLLDEPTRNLSPLLQPENFEGAIVVVSHEQEIEVYFL